MRPRILGLAKMFAIAVAALAAPAPYDLREAAQNVTPKAREPFFAPALAPCDAGFTPTCEQAKGFGLCDAASSACGTTCVDEVKKACPATCSLAPEETSGHELWTTGAAPPDYDQPAPAVAKEIICRACRDQPELPCCHNHPHDRKDRRLSQQCAGVLAAQSGVRSPPPRI